MHGFSTPAALSLALVPDLAPASANGQEAPDLGECPGPPATPAPTTVSDREPEQYLGALRAIARRTNEEEPLRQRPYRYLLGPHGTRA